MGRAADAPAVPVLEALATPDVFVMFVAVVFVMATEEDVPVVADVRPSVAPLPSTVTPAPSCASMIEASSETLSIVPSLSPIAWTAARSIVTLVAAPPSTATSKVNVFAAPAA